MALKATIFKADLQIADMDRGYYQTHALTIARHPSETDQRMMVRILAFALFADERLHFTRGISTDDEPDLWLKGLDEEIELWVDLGQPDLKRIRNACCRARQVVVLTYASRSADVWWRQNSGSLERFENLRVLQLPDDMAMPLESLAKRNMQLQCTIQGDEVWLGDEQTVLHLTPLARKHAVTP